MGLEITRCNITGTNLQFSNFKKEKSSASMSVEFLIGNTKVRKRVKVFDVTGLKTEEIKTKIKENFLAMYQSYLDSELNQKQAPRNEQSLITHFKDSGFSLAKNGVIRQTNSKTQLREVIGRINQVNTPITLGNHPPAPTTVIDTKKLAQNFFSVIGRDIVHDYKVDGILVGQQHISRSPALQHTFTYCDTMRKQIDDKKGNLLEEEKKASPARKIAIQNELKKLYAEEKYYIKQQQNIRTHIEEKDYAKPNWLASNTYRDSLKVANSYSEAADAYIACPVNLRHQELHDTRGNVELNFGRLGVISDMRNGFFSYRDLEKIRDGTLNVKTVLDKLDKDLKKLEKTSLLDRIKNLFKSKEKKLKIQAGIEKGKESIAFARHQLRNFATALEDSRSNPITKSTVDSIMRDRERVLEQQMMVYLQNQLEKDPEYVNNCIVTNQPINLVHVGLLSLNKQKMENGWKHDERVEMEDMDAVFEKFRGKTLIFDGSGPRIDGNNIYLAEQKKDATGKIIKKTLNTYFLNCSVQNGTKNDSAQGEINRRTVGAMGSFFSNEKLKADLCKKKGDSSYKLAKELVSFFGSKESPYKFSLGCLSAKDRASIIAEMATGEALNRRLRMPPSQAKKFFLANLFREGGAMFSVIKDNSDGGRPSLKADPIGLFFGRILGLRELFRFWRQGDLGGKND